MTGNEPKCQRCSSETVYSGMVSWPSSQIFRCKSCGHHTWVQRRRTERARVVTSKGLEQSPVQQQQHQPKADSGSEPQE